MNHHFHSRSSTSSKAYPEYEDAKKSFKPGGVYYFSNESRVSYEAVKDFVVNVLQSDLAKVCELHIDTPVSIKVSGNYDGSLVIVFSAVFNAIQLISGIKDVYDVAKLIRDLASERIESRLNKEYGNFLSVNVVQRMPGRSQENYYYNIRHGMKEGFFHPALMLDDKKPKRDAFFWYLLGINIVLFTIIVLLTVNALLAVYW